MDGEQTDRQQAADGLPIQSSRSEVNTERTSAGEQYSAPDSSRRQSILPEPTQQMLQELMDLPSQILPAETVHHLKNAGRETLLALYSLWQNMNRSTQADAGEKVRKHIEVE